MFRPPPRIAHRLSLLLIAVALFFAALFGHGEGPGVGRQAWTAASWPAWVGPARNFSPPPDFFDFKVVLWGIEVHRAGHDVYTEPPAMDAPFVYNYPSAWLAFAVLGWRIADVVPLASLMIGLFLLSFVGIMPVSRWRDVLCLAALLLSPPLLIAIGHANIDLAIFVLVVLAVWWHTRVPRCSAGPYGILAMAALLKLYPAAAVPALIDRRRHTLTTALVFLVALTLWFSSNLPELRKISDHTPRPTHTAFGCQVLASRFLEGASRQPAITQRMETFGGVAVWQRTLSLLSIGAYSLLLLHAAISGFRRRADLSAPAPQSLAETLFRSGALIFLGAFALGHNWAHREIFLILLIPACLPMAGAPPPGGLRSILPWLLLGLFWFTTLPVFAAFIVGQLGAWALTWWLARELVRHSASLFVPAGLRS